MKRAFQMSPLNPYKEYRASLAIGTTGTVRRTVTGTVAQNFTARAGLKRVVEDIKDGGIIQKTPEPFRAGTDADANHVLGGIES